MARIGFGTALVAAAALAAGGLAGCGGGTGVGVATLGISTIVGVAAKGNAVAGAEVLLKDRNGVTRTATTDANGAYGPIDVSGLAPPFLIRVSATQTGDVLFSVAAAVTAGANTVNVHPLTNLVVDSYYDAQHLTLTAVFDNLASTAVVPTGTEIRSVSTIVRRVANRWIAASGEDPLTFDLISTPFSASGLTGFDTVLDKTTVTADGRLTITDGTITTRATVTAGSDVDVAASTTDLSSGKTSASVDGGVIVTPSAQADLEAAAAGVVDLLTRISATVTARGAALADADILPFLDPDFLDRSLSPTEMATQLATVLRGGTISDLKIEQLVEFDAANQIATIIVSLNLTQGGATQRFTTDTEDHAGFRRFRRQPDGTFRFFGDQRYAKVDIEERTERRYDYDPSSFSSTSTDHFIFKPGVFAPFDRVASVTVTGVFPPTPSAQQLDLVKNEFGIVNNRDGFVIAFSREKLPFLPPAGSPYLFQVIPTPTSGFAPLTVTVSTRATTDEFIDITKYNGEDREPFHVSNPRAENVRGRTIRVDWTLPTTVPIREVRLRAAVSDSATSVDIQGNELLGPTSTTGTITIPEFGPSGGLVEGVSISVFIEGENGEGIMASDFWFSR